MASPRRVCVVGSGTEYLSGVSYYTILLTKALAACADMSVVLMRKLVPRRLYPGKERVGKALTQLSASTYAPTYDGVDWYLVPSIFGASRFLCRHRPEVIIVQWWTGAVLAPYLWLTYLGRRWGSEVIIEFHEDQDTGETAVPLAGRIGRLGLQRLARSAAAFVVHSDWDRERLSDLLDLDRGSVYTIPHGPYPMVAEQAGPLGTGGVTPAPAHPPGAGPKTEVTVLFFGTIRPYKGLEDLIDAFSLLPRGTGHRWRLLVVGETWEDWDLPLEKIAASPFRRDIELVNRYVTDPEVAAYYARADVVALPYHRASASGPLHLTMSAGLPVVVTRVGGLVEAAQSYSGTLFVPPHDPEALASALSEAVPLTDVRHSETYTWADVRERYCALMDELGN